jgi:DNA-directed RNA polymerase specialized sigma24 family protein
MINWQFIQEITMSKPYAAPNGLSDQTTSADFCQIFTEHMDSLYLLSLLLTADPEKAEQCFVAGLSDSAEGNPVFKEWALSWAKRLIVQRAIQMVSPATKKRSVANTLPPEGEIAPRLIAIFQLDTFERFVFVMSVLEKYSPQDCSILLGCSRQAVVEARSRALEYLGAAVKVGGAPREIPENIAMHVSGFAKLGLAIS